MRSRRVRSPRRQLDIPGLERAARLLLLVCGIMFSSGIRSECRVTKLTKTTAKVLFVALVSVAASVAISQNNQGQDNDNQGQNNRGRNNHGPVAAPEIDPGQAMGALALLGGTVAIIRGYRRKKK